MSGFQSLVTAAIWTILDAAEFLDPPLTFGYRRNDGYFSFNAISIYKVYYIDFWIKILERLFMNDQQILIEFFKSFWTLQCLVVTEAHTYLKLQVCLSMYDLLLLSGVKGLWRFPIPYKFRDSFIEIWIKFRFEKKSPPQKRDHPKPGVLQRRSY